MRNLFRRRSLNEFGLVVAALAMMGLSACSSSKDSPFDQRGVSPEGKHDVVKGPLFQAYRSVSESPYLTACDQKLKDARTTLIAALDQKAPEILKQATSSKNIPANFVPFAKSFLIDVPKKPARPGWQSEPYSWSRVYEYYAANVSKKAGPAFWTSIDAYVRSLITEDKKRVVYGYNMSLNHSQIEMLPALHRVVEACKTDTRCAQPRWSDDQLALIYEIPAYAHYQRGIENSRFFRDQRRNLDKLYSRINDDVTLHKDDFNNMVTHREIEGKHIYSIPLDASSFSDADRSVLENAITSVWSNESNKIDISWKISTPPTNYFRFLFELEPNNRSYVNFPLAEIHIFPYTALRTVAHEFGHVVGFDDHYYTLWDPEKCEYRAEYNEEDIMSGSETGDVTEAEWKSMLDRYGRR